MDPAALGLRSSQGDALEDIVSLAEDVDGTTMAVTTEQQHAQAQEVPNAHTSVPTGIVPKLQNVTATINLECHIDLKTVALKARNAEYNPKRFAAVIMRIRVPKCTALIFASGKMVVTGCKTEDDARLAGRKFGRILQKVGFNARFTDFKIQNMVAVCDAGFGINLQLLDTRHPHFSSYEPELFCGLVYRMLNPKAVFLIFVTGKVVITGARTREQIYTAFNQIYPLLQDFRKGFVRAAEP